MEKPGAPHVRVFDKEIYIERVPNAWVRVTSFEEWGWLNEQERNYLISKALKKGLDCSLPNKEPVRGTNY